jgi:hypothetical protein
VVRSWGENNFGKFDINGGGVLLVYVEKEKMGARKMKTVADKRKGEKYEKFASRH